MAKKSTLKSVTSLGDLFYRATSDKRYENLAVIAANNLGGNVKDLVGAKRILNMNAMETSEDGVVDEVNFCRDLVVA